MRAMLAIILICAALPLRAGEITVFAASSLTDVLTEIAAAWEVETGHRAVLSFAATSTLARQIERGAPVDVFVAADAEWVTSLGDKVIQEQMFTRNALVLIAHGAGSDLAAPVTSGSFADLADRPLAMALTDAVPAGRYGRAALEALGVWDGLRVAEAGNVRAALMLVATGAAPLGVVYASDAGATDAVHVVGLFDPALHPPILYPMVALSGASGDAEARASFWAYLQSEPALEALDRAGFVRP